MCLLDIVSFLTSGLRVDLALLLNEEETREIIDGGGDMIGDRVIDLESNIIIVIMLKLLYRSPDNNKKVHNNIIWEWGRIC